MTSSLLEDLLRHKGYIDSTLLRSIRNNQRAAQDEELRRLLHHTILANRFWLMQNLGRPFVLETEAVVPDSLEKLAERYRETNVEELKWIAGVRETDLDRRLESPMIPGGSCTVAESVLQVCLHGHGHRSQCASRLRLLGGTPPVLDFIVWLKDRPAALW